VVLEGTASMMVVYAISRADLVIIPTSASLLDAVEAVSAVQLVQRQEEAFRIKIPSAVLFTKTSAAIRTRTLTSIEDELAQNEVPIFSVRLHEREAFRSIFSFGGTLSNLDPKNVRNIPAAVENAQAFAAEVVNMLQTKRAAVAAVA
jgi:chromosome partitioning protein